MDQHKALIPTNKTCAKPQNNCRRTEHHEIKNFEKWLLHHSISNGLTREYQIQTKFEPGNALFRPNEIEVNIFRSSTKPERSNRSVKLPFQWSIFSPSNDFQLISPNGHTQIEFEPLPYEPLLRNPSYPSYRTLYTMYKSKAWGKKNELPQVLV